MFDRHGTFVDTDILVIGAGGGGLMAALGAKRAAPPGTRVAIADSWTVGHTGHTAFSNAWTVVLDRGSRRRPAGFIMVGFERSILVSILQLELER